MATSTAQSSLIYINGQAVLLLLDMCGRRCRIKRGSRWTLVLASVLYSCCLAVKYNSSPVKTFPRMPGHPPGFFDATEMPTAGWWEALWPAPHEIVTAVGISPDMEVVDLCSGDGWFTLQIAKRAHYVVAIDIEPKLLETARHRLAEIAALSKEMRTTY